MGFNYTFQEYGRIWVPLKRFSPSNDNAAGIVQISRIYSTMSYQAVVPHGVCMNTTTSHSPTYPQVYTRSKQMIPDVQCFQQMWLRSYTQDRMSRLSSSCAPAINTLIRVKREDTISEWILVSKARSWCCILIVIIPNVLQILSWFTVRNTAYMFGMSSKIFSTYHSWLSRSGIQQ